jgi:hypothetical protein
MASKFVLLFWRPYAMSSGLIAASERGCCYLGQIDTNVEFSPTVSNWLTSNFAFSQ